MNGDIFGMVSKIYFCMQNGKKDLPRLMVKIIFRCRIVIFVGVMDDETLLFFPLCFDELFARPKSRSDRDV